MATTISEYAVCLDNAGYEASLERGKHYAVIADPAAEAHGLLRVADESGEDYVYPTALFQNVLTGHHKIVGPGHRPRNFQS